MKKTIIKKYNDYIQNSHSKDEQSIKQVAHQYAKMRRIKLSKTYGKGIRGGK